jgi:hypothetical protein
MTTFAEFLQESLSKEVLEEGSVKEYAAEIKKIQKVKTSEDLIKVMTQIDSKLSGGSYKGDTKFDSVASKYKNSKPELSALFMLASDVSKKLK